MGDCNDNITIYDIAREAGLSSATVSRILNGTAQIAFGKADDPESYVAEFRQALLDAGYEQCIEEVERQLAETCGE